MFPLFVLFLWGVVFAAIEKHNGFEFIMPTATVYTANNAATIAAVCPQTANEAGKVH